MRPVGLAESSLSVELIWLLAGNGYVQGQNLSSLFPRWLNIRRGALLVAATALLIQPWRFAGTANSFAKFLSVASMINAAAGGI